jgi:hypothetical protein
MLFLNFMFSPLDSLISKRQVALTWRASMMSSTRSICSITCPMVMLTRQWLWCQSSIHCYFRHRYCSSQHHNCRLRFFQWFPCCDARCHYGQRFHPDTTGNFHHYACYGNFVAFASSIRAFADAAAFRSVQYIGCLQRFSYHVPG